MIRFACGSVAAFALLNAGGLSRLHAQAETQTFRTGTRLVEVDVVVRSKDSPATGLSKEDFTLLDNGKPQEISVFSIKGAESSIPTAGLPPGAGQAPAPLPPGTYSNRSSRDREETKTATVLLIDQRNTPRNDQIYAIQRVAKFLASFPPGNRIAVYTFGRDGLRPLQDLTDNAELLRAAASTLQQKDPGALCDGLEGRAAENCTRQEIFARVMDTKRALKAVARHLAQVPGRKNLIWVTASLPIAGKDFDFSSDMQEAAHALNESNLALYAVDARGLIGALSGTTAIANAESRGNPQAAQMAARKLTVGPSGIETMNLLAGYTGGEVYFNNNGIEDSIQSAVADGEFSYALGFYPEAAPDGLWHNLKVEVARPGVSVRYRKNYFSARTEDLASAHPTMEQLMQDPLEATQLEIVAETAPDPARPGFLQVKVSVDPRRLEWRQENAQRSGGFTVAFFVEGASQVPTRTQTYDNIPDNQFDSFLRRGASISESVDIAGAGRTLRVVVQDQIGGAAGSLTIPLPNTPKRSGKGKK
jgi:VWFA-related protein